MSIYSLTRAVEKINVESMELLATYDSPILKERFVQMFSAPLRSPNLSLGEKVLYALLSDYAYNHIRISANGGEGSCFPGQERLAKECGRSVAWVRATTRELEEKGLIEVRQQGQTQPNVYVIRTTWITEPDTRRLW